MSRSAGYSLFEVLIAFVIMSLVLATLIPGQARLLGRATSQEEQLLAYDYALSRVAMAEISALPFGVQKDTYRNWPITTEVTLGSNAGINTASQTVSIKVHNFQGALLAHVQTLTVVP